jgi:hypothetical protein
MANSKINFSEARQEVAECSDFTRLAKAHHELSDKPMLVWNNGVPKERILPLYTMRGSIPLRESVVARGRRRAMAAECTTPRRCSFGDGVPRELTTHYGYIRNGDNTRASERLRLTDGVVV